MGIGKTAFFVTVAVVLVAGLAWALLGNSDSEKRLGSEYPTPCSLNTPTYGWCSDDCAQVHGPEYYCARDCTCRLRQVGHNYSYFSNCSLGNYDGGYCQDDCVEKLGAAHLCTANCSCIDIG